MNMSVPSHTGFFAGIHNVIAGLHTVWDTLFAAEATVLPIPVQLHDTHNSCISVPHSLLGVVLVNELVHMHRLIGGVGVHWYYIISRASAGLGPKRLLPAIIVGSMECVVFWLECTLCVAVAYSG